MANHNNSVLKPSAISISNNYKMLTAANTAATPKRRGSSNSSLNNVELRSEHSSSIYLDISERSYHQQSEELVHNTSDSSFIKLALLKQKQKIWNEQHEMDNTIQQQQGE